MEVNKIRNEFMIYVVDDEDSIRQIVREVLVGGGYQVRDFPDAEKALEAIKESPPHLIMSDIRMPGMTGIEFLKKVRELSEDIQFIIMTSHASLETAIEALKAGAYDYLHKPFENINDVTITVDRAMQSLYMKFENEQLLQELAEKNEQLAQVNVKVTMENMEIAAVNSLMTKMAKTIDPEQVIQNTVEAVSDLFSKRPVIFLKWLQAYSSLVISHVAELDVSQLRNVGLNMSSFDPKKVPEILAQPQQLTLLADLMREVFKTTEYTAVPFFNRETLTGIFVVFSKTHNEVVTRVFESFIQVTKVSYDNATMARKIQEMAIKDPLTGIYNRRFFNEKLEEEISRSRRTRLPVSLIYLDIDHFKKYNDQNGHPMGDVIIKSVAQILWKTSRKNDICARLGGEEFGLILPHTAALGAAKKAEKIRMTVEQTKFPHGEKQPLGRVTCSLGVSEYPSFASDPESLIKTADDCLYRVKQAGRNRVCLAEAPPGFKPEFEPLPVPTYPSGAEEGRGSPAKSS